MLHGLDTSFLVALEVAEHPQYAAAHRTLIRIISAGDQLAISPQVLAEFMHVVTDARRFKIPFDMDVARQLSLDWWLAKEVVQIYYNDAAVRQFHTWMQIHSLGRKRILDTLLAATFESMGIRSILTANPGDFSVFGVFNSIAPGD